MSQTKSRKIPTRNILPLFFEQVLGRADLLLHDGKCRARVILRCTTRVFCVRRAARALLDLQTTATAIAAVANEQEAVFLEKNIRTNLQKFQAFSKDGNCWKGSLHPRLCGYPWPGLAYRCCCYCYQANDTVVQQPLRLENFTKTITDHALAFIDERTSQQRNTQRSRLFFLVVFRALSCDAKGACVKSQVFVVPCTRALGSVPAHSRPPVVRWCVRWSTQPTTTWGFTPAYCPTSWLARRFSNRLKHVPLHVARNPVARPAPHGGARVRARVCVRACSHAPPIHVKHASLAGAQQPDVPWYFFMAYFHVHTPLFTNRHNRGRSRGGRFGDNIEELDDSVGQLVARLKAHEASPTLKAHPHVLCARVGTFGRPLPASEGTHGPARPRRML